MAKTFGKITDAASGHDSAQRRWDIDLLRIVAIVSVFLYHNSRFFDFDYWHVKNNVPDAGLTMLAGFLDIWIMPLMFVISGAATYWALGLRGAAPFLRARLLRLAVPLVFGIFFLASPQVYLERLAHGQFSGSFIQFLPLYFDGWYGFGGNFAWMGLHLWYLQMLFLFSLLALPLFLYLRGESGRRLTFRLAGVFERPGGVFLLCLPAIVLEASLAPDGIGLRDFGGWGIFAYLSLFLCGYLVFSEPRIERAVRRQGYVALALAILATATLIVSVSSAGNPRYGTLEYPLVMGLRAFSSWCWVLAFLTLANRFLNFSNRLSKYASEAVLPFYILHQPVILMVGFYLASWQIGVLPKYLVLAATSFVVIMVTYELLVRRIALLRFLFGLKVTAREQVRGAELAGARQV